MLHQKQAKSDFIAYYRSLCLLQEPNTGSFISMSLQNTAANPHDFWTFRLPQSQMFMQSQTSLNQSSLLSGNWFNSQSCFAPQFTSIFGIKAFGEQHNTNTFLSPVGQKCLYLSDQVFIFEILSQHQFWTGLRSLLGLPVPVSDSSDSTPGRLRVSQQWKIELCQWLFLYHSAEESVNSIWQGVAQHSF